MPLINDAIEAIRLHDVGDFSVRELFFPEDWANSPLQEKRGLGRAVFKRVTRGVVNTEDSIVEPIPDTSPQRYSKRKIQPPPQPVRERVYLNEISGIEQTCFSGYLKILEACGKWLEIVDKPCA
jgi:hypothetical protein